MVAQAIGGVIAHEGTFAPDGLGMTTTSISDYSAGVFLALGIVGALLARERTGRGQKVETNLLNAILACQYRPMNNVERFDAEPRREFIEKVAEAARAGYNIRELFELRQSHLGANTRNIYWRPYATKDGFLAVACLNNVMRRSLRDLLGIDDPAIDGTSYGGTTREENAALVAQVEPIFRSRTTQEWFGLLDDGRRALRAAQRARAGLRRPAGRQQRRNLERRARAGRRDPHAGPSRPLLRVAGHHAVRAAGARRRDPGDPGSISVTAPMRSSA